jgi:hypothetical protein
MANKSRRFNTVAVASNLSVFADLQRQVWVTHKITDANGAVIEEHFPLETEEAEQLIRAQVGGQLHDDPTPKEMQQAKESIRNLAGSWHVRTPTNPISGTPLTPGKLSGTADKPPKLKPFLEYLDSLDLELYVNSSNETPSLRVPGDKLQLYYPISHRRVERWLFRKYLDLTGEPLPARYAKDAVAYLESVAYERGVVLPEHQKTAAQDSDPVLAAIAQLLSPSEQRVKDTASALYTALSKLGKEHHPEMSSFPRTIAALGRHLRVLEDSGMLAKLNLKFSAIHTRTGNYWQIERVMPMSEGVKDLDEPPSPAKASPPQELRCEETEELWPIDPTMLEDQSQDAPQAAAPAEPSPASSAQVRPKEEQPGEHKEDPPRINQKSRRVKRHESRQQVEEPDVSG